MATTDKSKEKTVPEKVGEVVRETGRHIKEAAENLSGRLTDKPHPPSHKEKTTKKK